MNSAPLPSHFQPGAQRLIAGSLFVLVLVAPSLAGCRSRSGQPAPAIQPTSTGASAMTASTDASTARAATPSPTPPPTATSLPASPAPLPNSFPPTPPATAEPLAPASLLEQAAYLHRIGDFRREQRLLETALAANRTAPAGSKESTPASLLRQRSALFYQLALSYLAGGQPAAALDALEQLRRLGDLLPVDGAGPQPDGEDAVAQYMINGIFLRAEALAAAGPLLRSRNRLPRIPGKASPPYRRRRGVCRRCLARHR